MSAATWSSYPWSPAPDSALALSMPRDNSFDDIKEVSSRPAPANCQLSSIVDCTQIGIVSFSP